MNLLLRHTVIFVLYLVAQLLVFNHLTLLELASAHVFLVALLVLPVNTPFPLLIFLGFGLGMAVDVFSVGAFKGVSAFAGVLMLALRNGWVSVITNRVAFRGNEENLIRTQPFAWTVHYLLPLVIVFELCYHLLEAFSFDHILLTLLKAGASTAFTFLLVFIFTYWIHQDSKR